MPLPEQHSKRVNQRVQDNSTIKECSKMILLLPINTTRENKALQKRLAKHGLDNNDIRKENKSVGSNGL